MKLKPARMGLTIALATVVLLAAAGCSSRSRLDRHLERANGFFEAENYQEAIIEYINVLTIDARHAEALRRMGLCHYNTGNAGEALRFLLAANQAEPDQTDVQLRVATIFLMAGGSAQAREHLEAVLEREPENPEALLLLSETAFDEAELAPFQARLEAAGQLLREDKRYHIALGNILARQGNLEAAEAAYGQALELAPEDSTPHERLARLYQAKDEPERAEEAFDRAMELAAPVSRTRMAWAVFKTDLGKGDEAREGLVETLEANADYLPAHFQLARMAFAERNFEACHEHLNAVLKQAPGHMEALALKGRLDLVEGRTDEALKTFDGLVERAPAEPNYRYQRSLARIRAGAIQTALADLREVVQMRPNAPEPRILLAELYVRTGNTRGAVRTCASCCGTGPTMRAPGCCWSWRCAPRARSTRRRPSVARSWRKTRSSRASSICWAACCASRPTRRAPAPPSSDRSSWNRTRPRPSRNWW